MDSVNWDARYAASELVWGAEPNRFVVEEFTGVPPGRALDLGAGEGRNAIWLATHGWRVTAVDFSRVAVERAARLAATRGVSVDWVVADLRTYRPEAGAYDAVLIAYLHLPAAQRALVLGRAAEALAPGGQIVVVGHDLANLSVGVGGPQDPAILYTPEAIVAELPGLVVRCADRVSRPVEADGAVVAAVDTLVHAVREPVGPVGQPPGEPAG